MNVRNKFVSGLLSCAVLLSMFTFSSASVLADDPKSGGSNNGAGDGSNGSGGSQWEKMNSHDGTYAYKIYPIVLSQNKMNVDPNTGIDGDSVSGSKQSLLKPEVRFAYSGNYEAYDLSMYFAYNQDGSPLTVQGICNADFKFPQNSGLTATNGAEGRSEFIGSSGWGKSGNVFCDTILPAIVNKNVTADNIGGDLTSAFNSYASPETNSTKDKTDLYTSYIQVLKQCFPKQMQQGNLEKVFDDAVRNNAFSIAVESCVVDRLGSSDNFYIVPEDALSLAVAENTGINACMDGTDGIGGLVLSHGSFGFNAGTVNGNFNYPLYPLKNQAAIYAKDIADSFSTFGGWGILNFNQYNCPGLFKPAIQLHQYEEFNLTSMNEESQYGHNGLIGYKDTVWGSPTTNPVFTVSDDANKTEDDPVPSQLYALQKLQYRVVGLNNGKVYVDWSDVPAGGRIDASSAYSSATSDSTDLEVEVKSVYLGTAPDATSSQVGSDKANPFTVASTRPEALVQRFDSMTPFMKSGKLLDTAISPVPFDVVALNSGISDVSQTRFPTGVSYSSTPVTGAASNKFKESAAWYNAQVQGTATVPSYDLVDYGSWGTVQPDAQELLSRGVCEGQTNGFSVKNYPLGVQGADVDKGSFPSIDALGTKYYPLSNYRIASYSAFNNVSSGDSSGDGGSVLTTGLGAGGFLQNEGFTTADVGRVLTQNGTTYYYNPKYTAWGVYYGYNRSASSNLGSARVDVSYDTCNADGSIGSTGNKTSTTVQLYQPSTDTKISAAWYLYQPEKQDGQGNHPSVYKDTHEDSNKYIGYTSTGTQVSFSSQSDNTLYVDPEVQMDYDTMSSTKTPVWVAADTIRQIKPVSYHVVAIDNSGLHVTSSATSVAADSRATSLAGKLGVGGTPVYMSGSGITATYSGTKLSFTSFILDVSKSQYETDWANAVGVSGSNVWNAGNIHNSFLSNFKQLDETPLVSTGADEQGKDQELKFKSAAHIDLTDLLGLGNTSTGTNPTAVTTYSLTVKAGKITDVGGLPTSVYDPAHGVDKMDLDKTVAASFQHDNAGNFGNWYNEDSSTLVVRQYATTVDVPDLVVTDKLPLGFGPKSPDNKQALFTNGWKSWLNADFQFTLPSSSLSPYNTDNNSKTFTFSVRRQVADTSLKPNFILPDASVLDTMTNQ